MQTAKRTIISISSRTFFKTASLPRPFLASSVFAVIGSEANDLTALTQALDKYAIGVDGTRLFNFSIQTLSDGSYNVDISNAECFVLVKDASQKTGVNATVTQRNYKLHLDRNSVLMVSKGSGICGSDISYLAGSRSDMLGDQGKVLGHEAVGQLIWHGRDVETSLTIGQDVVVNPFIKPADPSLHHVPHLGPDQRYMGVPGINGTLTNGPIRVDISQLAAAPQGNNAFLVEPYSNGMYAVSMAEKIAQKGAFPEHEGQVYSFKATDPTPTPKDLKALPRGSVLVFERCPADLTADHFTEMQRGSFTLKFETPHTSLDLTDSTAPLSRANSSDSIKKLFVAIGDGIAGNCAALDAFTRGHDVVLIGTGSEKITVDKIVDQTGQKGSIRRMKMDDFLALHAVQQDKDEDDEGFESPSKHSFREPITVIDCCGHTTALEQILSTGSVTTILGVARPKHFPETFRNAVNQGRPFLYKLMYRFDPTTFHAAAEALRHIDLSRLVTGEFSLKDTDKALKSLAGKNPEDTRKHVKVVIKTAHDARV